MNPKSALSICSLIISLVSCHNVTDYGGVYTQFEPEVAIEFANTNAFIKTIHLANSSDFDRTIVIPKIENSTIFMMPILLEYLKNITIVINGDIKASSYRDLWPNHTDDQMYKSSLYASNH